MCDWQCDFQMRVQYVQEVSSQGLWQVLYTQQGSDELHIVTAPVVILAAGTLGSNEILMRSKEKGLLVSDRLGEGYSSNGDQLGMVGFQKTYHVFTALDKKWAMCMCMRMPDVAT